MMKSIWKYTLQVTDRQWLEMQIGAKVLSVQVQKTEKTSSLVLWALVNPNLDTARHLVRIVGTGHSADDVADLTYLGTVQMNMSGNFVWHVFMGHKED